MGGFSFGSVSVFVVNMCVFSIGIEIDGSVMFFVDWNVVVGIKLMVGLIFILGVIFEFFSMDIVGIFGRLIEDVIVVLDIIVDKFNFRVYCDGFYILSLVKKDVLKGVKFGLLLKCVWELVVKSIKYKFEYVVF